MKDEIQKFNEEVEENITRLEQDSDLKQISEEWFCRSMEDKYSYNFRWMGRPIIQYPQDILAMQEIIWNVQPDLIIETGIAHGGSLIFYASMLELMGKGGHVLGIDIDIREHNRRELEKHPMYKRITMFEGSSIADDMIERVNDFAKNYKRVLVVLDSLHSEEHVFMECIKYSPLVKCGSYLVVMDTCCEMVYRRQSGKENLPEWLERPWGLGNNAMTGMKKFLETTDRFETDRQIDAKLQISCAPNGYLKCIKD